MLIHGPVYDELLLSGQPPLNGHLLVSQGWPLIGGSTVIRHKSHSKGVDCYWDNIYKTETILFVLILEKCLETGKHFLERICFILYGVRIFMVTLIIERMIEFGKWDLKGLAAVAFYFGR